MNRPFSLIYEGTEYTIATLTITSGGVATITFQEDINDLSEVSATFDMQGALDEAAIGFVPDEPPPPPVTAGKSGTYNPNTNEVTWTVTVDSGGPSITVEDVYVVDTLGADQAYKPGTSSIGEPTYDAVEDTSGNFSVVGHRNSAFGEFFNRLDEVEVGDVIIVKCAGESYTYVVSERLVVEPEDTWVLDPTPEASITLVTCTGKRFATRLIVRGVLGS